MTIFALNGSTYDMYISLESAVRKGSNGQMRERPVWTSLKRS